MSNPGPFRYSRQREKILEFLKDNKEHPSADAIYVKMKEYFPSISLGTVYRNLGVLHEQGLVNRIMHAEGPDRFDADMFTHSHFYCEKCGEIYDISEDDSATATGILMDGHKVNKHITSYYGICSNCIKQSH
jgi:Fur family peroxide stress response transcriptional regulator